MIKKIHSRILCFVFLLMQISLPARGELVANNAEIHETTANSIATPQQILKTGVSLSAPGLAPNTIQVANTIGFMPVLERVQALRTQLKNPSGHLTLESLGIRQDLWDTVQQGALIIQKTDLDIDFTLAEINAELQVYNEMLATFTSQRDKLLAKVNAASFISNGVLWALAEGFDIPTYRYTRLSIPSGTLGIAAGVIPSIASMYTLKAVNGKKTISETNPNMLAKLFGYPTNADIEYPNSVWQFLNQVPADQDNGKKRIDQLIDHWVADANIPAFTNRSSQKQLDVITASIAQRKGLSIAALSTRQAMLQQLSCEIMKMKRMLLELAMALEGDKTLAATKRTGANL